MDRPGGNPRAAIRFLLRYRPAPVVHRRDSPVGVRGAVAAAATLTAGGGRGGLRHDHLVLLVYPEYNTLQPVYGAVGLFQIGLLLALIGVSSVGRELRLRF